MNVYFDKEETEYVKGQPRGWVRGLVRDAMTAKSVPEMIEELEEPDIRSVIPVPAEARGPRLRR